MHLDFNDQVKESMPSEDEFITVTEIFQQLCDSTRLRILWILSHSCLSVTDLAQYINMSSPAVSHHLRFLKKSDLVTSSRHGKEMHYTLADNDVARMVHKMIDDAFNNNCPNK